MDHLILPLLDKLLLDNVGFEQDTQCQECVVTFYCPATPESYGDRGGVRGAWPSLNRKHRLDLSEAILLAVLLRALLCNAHLCFCPMRKKKKCQV